ncbi:uncharacterized protein BXZ73DRAFT_97722 [Epithele typhae]|uniref:uncharacterized protein n=1 Tax=Epithele typhae TaxID=378194 RepID=UPI002007ED86|nr:uncharacterized protein BXZ73DRAFT_97722 [Epithele typhae]KAH9942310.1 hypothetical protein BXZ73DRAFT_97722 [Epithele typhae]
MSLARAAGAVIRPSQRATTSLFQRRAASSHSHDEHHHEEHQDSDTYEPQSWNTPFWRRAVLASFGVVAFYKYAPSPNDENAITKSIAANMISSDVWEHNSLDHLYKSAERAVVNLLTADAKPPPVHRLRFPQRIEMYAPSSHPVGIKL